MGASKTARDGEPPTAGQLEREIARETSGPARWWSNAPGDTYGRHEHAYHKVLFCSEGSITFHLDDSDVTLQAGDRLDIEPGTGHAATVGPNGVTCVEGARDS